MEYRGVSLALAAAMLCASIATPANADRKPGPPVPSSLKTEASTAAKPAPTTHTEETDATAKAIYCRTGSPPPCPPTSPAPPAPAATAVTPPGGEVPTSAYEDPKGGQHFDRCKRCPKRAKSGDSTPPAAPPKQ